MGRRKIGAGAKATVYTYGPGCTWHFPVHTGIMGVLYVCGWPDDSPAGRRMSLAEEPV